MAKPPWNVPLKARKIAPPAETPGLPLAKPSVLTERTKTWYYLDELHQHKFLLEGCQNSDDKYRNVNKIYMLQ